MRPMRTLTVAALCLLSVGVARAEEGERPNHRVLVELFTSQG